MSSSRVVKRHNKKGTNSSLFYYGDSRIRTGDLLRATQTLYLLSYTPSKINFGIISHAPTPTRTEIYSLGRNCFIQLNYGSVTLPNLPLISGEEWRGY